MTRNSFPIKLQFLSNLALAILVLVAINLVETRSASAASDLRVWSTLDGKFSTLAEFDSFNGDHKVVLLKPNGNRITVPISLLSGEDKTYLLELKRTVNQSTTSAKTSKSSYTNASATELGKKDAKIRTAEDIEREAKRASTAEEAVLVYELNLSAGNIPFSDKPIIEERLRYWKEQARLGMVRLGKDWISKEDAKKARERARMKIDQAVEYLRLKNGKMAEEALRQASRIDPDSTEAHQVIGLIYGLIDNNDRMATIAYRECLKRDPGNAVILNNLAISEFFTKRYNEAFRHWNEAANLSPDTELISQNLGSALSVYGQSNIRVSNSIAHEAGDTYHQLLTKYGHERPEKVQFYYILPTRFQREGGSYDNGDGELIAVGSGTGFVIADGIILTNQHVVENADGLLIVDPEDSTNRLKAHVIAENEDLDLAIVGCSSLRAEPVTLTTSTPGRGADIMVLGYPLGPGFGMNLKSTRGAIVALPTNQAEDRHLVYDALTNPGNSGGPVADRQGRVIGVVRAIMGDIGGKYGLAIPMETAVAFLNKHNIDYSLDQSSISSELGWPAVDAKVGPSTVLVMNRQRSTKSKGHNR